MSLIEESPYWVLEPSFRKEMLDLEFWQIPGAPREELPGGSKRRSWFKRYKSQKTKQGDVVGPVPDHAETR